MEIESSLTDVNESYRGNLCKLNDELEPSDVPQLHTTFGSQQQHADICNNSNGKVMWLSLCYSRRTNTSPTEPEPYNVKKQPR